MKHRRLRHPARESTCLCDLGIKDDKFSAQGKIQFSVYDLVSSIDFFPHSVAFIALTVLSPDEEPFGLP